MVYFRRIDFEPQCSEAIAVCVGCRGRYRLVRILEVDTSEEKARAREVVKAHPKAMLESASSPDQVWVDHGRYWYGERQPLNRRQLRPRIMSHTTKDVEIIDLS